jgi:hypothetical protein
VFVTVALAALEALHPPTLGADVAPWFGWIPLHVALLVGYAALVWLLWRIACGRLYRGALLAFGTLNTTYLLVDGIARSTSPLAAVLADATGAAWAAALLLLASSGAPRPVQVGAALTWLAFVGSAPPLGLPVIASRTLALATAAGLAYATGAPAVPAALLIFSAVLRQHVGPEAALGLLLLVPALSLRGRSAPAAVCPP